jgi:hypothetical protein
MRHYPRDSTSHKWQITPEKLEPTKDITKAAFIMPPDESTETFQTTSEALVSDENPNLYTDTNLRNQIYMECASMAKYALAKGKAVPADAIKNIEAFENYSSAENNSEDNLLQIRRDIDITALIDTHYLLARLIEPATPRTVLLLDREQRNKTMLNFLGTISLVRQLMLIAIISLIIFIALLSSPYINGAKLEQDVLSATGIEQFARLIFYIGAAGLGASFAALYKVNDYISKGTYEPAYQASYWIRFLLGIIAGLLLAVLISEQSIQSDGMLSKGVIRPLLAILGGFSADLLYTFLDRIEETFKSLFAGSTQTMLDTKTLEAKSKLANLEVDVRMKLAQNLMEMQQKIGTETDSEQVKQQINDMLNNLVKPK